MSQETVGSLLAVIANSLNDGLRILMFADKREWGSDEFEQLRLLEETLDEAKKDFQELPALVNGRFYYENDRIDETLEDLRILCTRFELHVQMFRDWVRHGGPIDPSWALETTALRRELHRAQCRAARRIYSAQQIETSAESVRCLGALQVYRVQKGRDVRVEDERAACAQTGHFERYADRDVAFVCDFCDGFLVWEDLRAVPTTRINQPPPRNDDSLPAPVTRATRLDDPRRNNNGNKGNGNGEGEVSPAAANWQARGIALSNGEQKTIIFAPVAVANHVPPDIGEWQSRILCPHCDEYYYEEQGDNDMERIRHTQGRGFETVAAFQEHLEWSHASMVPSASSCAVM
ncbi:uncharacterized protein F4812DRAFT_76414 [Daldinia caldariorum]|uniref:uncharacterized protein n=1 Tax=Daldinia caldariorum TaxID=326644 RepID=UPI002007EDF4|nr:uncharacterized protein F4812DRAFT_76414 [Daldinia caldariorum]KAI1466353.1 hypothetical protein F4812DRAFT_76414 [Daldinia caldariorum]